MGTQTNQGLAYAHSAQRANANKEGQTRRANKGEQTNAKDSSGCSIEQLSCQKEAWHKKLTIEAVHRD